MALRAGTKAIHHHVSYVICYLLSVILSVLDYATNPDFSRDPSLRPALPGIPLQDPEFVQFHPTGIYGAGCLITEGDYSAHLTVLVLTFFNTSKSLLFTSTGLAVSSLKVIIDCVILSFVNDH